jgi:hypothetical protein
VALAVDADGDFLLTLQTAEDGTSQISGYARQPDGYFRLGQHVAYTAPAHWLCPLVVRENSIVRLGLWGGGDLCLLDWPSLATLRLIATWENPVGFGALMLPGFGKHASSIAVLHWYVGSACYHATPHAKGQNLVLGWNLGRLRDAPGQPVPISWLHAGDSLELAGIDEDGALHWCRLHCGDDRVEERGRSTAAPDEGYRAVAVVRPGLVAGVTARGVHWLRGGQRFLQVAQHPAPSAGRAIAAFASRPTQELILLCADGTVERLNVPNL